MQSETLREKNQGAEKYLANSNLFFRSHSRSVKYSKFQMRVCVYLNIYRCIYLSILKMLENLNDCILMLTIFREA